MTVSNENRSQFFDGNGVTTDFDFTFKYYNANEISVYVGGVLQDVADYTLTPSVSGDGGTISMGTPPVAGTANVLVLRTLPYVQNTSIPVVDKLGRGTLENAYDYLTMLVQQVREGMERTARVADVVDVSGFNLTIIPAPSRLIGINAAGDGIELYAAADIGPVLLPTPTNGYMARGDGGSSFTFTELGEVVHQQPLITPASGDYILFADASAATPYSAGKATVAQLQTVLGKYPEGYMSGPPPQWVSASQVKVPAGFRCRDASNTYDMIVSSDATASLAASGAGGLDTGSEATSTHYYHWLIMKTDGTTASLFSTSATTPTMPTGYTIKRRMPVTWYNDGSSNLIEQFFAGGALAFGEWLYNVAFSEATTPAVGPTNILNAGTQTSFTDVTATYVSPLSNVGIFTGFGNNYRAWFRTKGESHNGILLGTSISGGEVHFEPFKMQTDASRVIQYKAYTSSTISLDVLGFVVTSFA